MNEQRFENCLNDVYRISADLEETLFTVRKTMKVGDAGSNLEFTEAMIGELLCHINGVVGCITELNHISIMWRRGLKGETTDRQHKETCKW